MGSSDPRTLTIKLNAEENKTVSESSGKKTPVYQAFGAELNTDRTYIKFLLDITVPGYTVHSVFRFL